MKISWKTFLVACMTIATMGAGPAMADALSLLPAVFQTPGEQWREGYYDYQAVDKKVRYVAAASSTPDNDKAVVLILPGMTEFAEKYTELGKDLNARGHDVWMMDWPGQGKSDRFLSNSHKIHVPNYDVQGKLVPLFVDDVIKPQLKGRKLVLLAHSMGGHFTLRAIAGAPDVADAAILSSPMVEINGGGIPGWLVNGLASGSSWFGLDEDYSPGRGDWVPNPDYTVEQSLTTSDPDRFDVHQSFYLVEPQLISAGPTWGWVKESFRSRDWLMEEGRFDAVTMPVLMTTAEIDHYVLTEPQKVICDRIPNCRQEVFTGALHEIYMERDDIRDRWLESVTRFLDDQKR